MAPVSLKNTYSFPFNKGGLCRAMMLGSLQCLSVLLLWVIVGQGPAVLAVNAGRKLIFLSLIYLIIWETAGHD